MSRPSSCATTICRPRPDGDADAERGACSTATSTSCARSRRPAASTARVEFLPNEEVVAERKAAGLGLTRPELAVLLAYAKIQLEDEMVETDLPDDPQLGDELAELFPAAAAREIRRRHRQRHRLRREIVTTVIANELVNRAGITFVHDAREHRHGRRRHRARLSPPARSSSSAHLWQQVEALDNKVPAACSRRCCSSRAWRSAEPPGSCATSRSAWISRRR